MLISQNPDFFLFRRIQIFFISQFRKIHISQNPVSPAVSLTIADRLPILLFAIFYEWVVHLIDWNRQNMFVTW